MTVILVGWGGDESEYRLEDQRKIWAARDGKKQERRVRAILTE